MISTHSQRAITLIDRMAHTDQGLSPLSIKWWAHTHQGLSPYQLNDKHTLTKGYHIYRLNDSIVEHWDFASLGQISHITLVM